MKFLFVLALTLMVGHAFADGVVAVAPVVADGGITMAQFLNSLLLALMAGLGCLVAYYLAPAHQAALEHTIMAQSWVPVWVKGFIPTALSAGLAWIGTHYFGIPAVVTGPSAMVLAGATHKVNESEGAADSANTDAKP